MEKSPTSNEKPIYTETPVTHTTLWSSMQKQKSTKIPTSALNIYKKYLTIQKEGQSKDPSVSINDISKTLSIDTFNTEWLPFNIE